MTAVMETEAPERLVAERDSSVLFMSRRRGLRLVKTQIFPLYGPGGRKIGDEPGETVAFRDGALRVPHEGDMLLEDGRKIPAAEVLEWLEQHPRLNDVNEGFWRVDPSAPAPSEAEMRAIMQAAVELDEDKLAALIEQEEGGWGREAILNTARDALDRIREVREAAAENAKSDVEAKAEPEKK